MKLFETLYDTTLLNESYYKPHYDETLKMPGGAVKDWFVKMGASQADIDAAMKKAKSLQSYKQLCIWFPPYENDRLNKNGTFCFAMDDGAKYYVVGSGLLLRISQLLNKSSLLIFSIKWKISLNAIVELNGLK